MSNRQYSVLQQVVSEATGTPGTTGRGAYLAGLAINEAIDLANTMVDVWFLYAHANLTLVSGTRSYTLSTSWPNFSSHISTVLLSSDGTRRERFVLFLPDADFERAGYETTNLTGAPSYLTINPQADLIVIDRDPTATFNGRILRTLYYKKLARLSSGTATLGVDDSAEDWIVQEALWRARRYANLEDWREWKGIADTTRKRVIAKPLSVDIASMGLL